MSNGLDDGKEIRFKALKLAVESMARDGFNPSVDTEIDVAEQYAYYIQTGERLPS